jgi:hypothetical protein
MEIVPVKRSLMVFLMIYGGERTNIELNIPAIMGSGSHLSRNNLILFPV